jgi:hypothetical protein
MSSRKTNTKERMNFDEATSPPLFFLKSKRSWGKIFTIFYIFAILIA